MSLKSQEDNDIKKAQDLLIWLKTRPGTPPEHTVIKGVYNNLSEFLNFDFVITDLKQRVCNSGIRSEEDFHSFRMDERIRSARLLKKKLGIRAPEWKEMLDSLSVSDHKIRKEILKYIDLEHFNLTRSVFSNPSYPPNLRMKAYRGSKIEDRKSLLESLDWKSFLNFKYDHYYEMEKYFRYKEWYRLVTKYPKFVISQMPVDRWYDKIVQELFTSTDPNVLVKVIRKFGNLCQREMIQFLFHKNYEIASAALKKLNFSFEIIPVLKDIIIPSRFKKRTPSKKLVLELTKELFLSKGILNFKDVKDIIMNSKYLEQKMMVLNRMSEKSLDERKLFIEILLNYRDFDLSIIAHVIRHLWFIQDEYTRHKSEDCKMSDVTYLGKLPELKESLKDILVNITGDKKYEHGIRLDALNINEAISQYEWEKKYFEYL